MNYVFNNNIQKERSTSAEVTPEKQGGTEPSGGLEKETSPALFNFLERVATASTPPGNHNIYLSLLGQSVFRSDSVFTYRDLNPFNRTLLAIFINH